MHCDGALIKSNVGARHSRFDTEKQSWFNPYVTDGLIGMWDGEWNAGGGMHNFDSVVWKDLVGNNDMFIYGNAAFSYISLSIDETSYAYSFTPITTVGTLEICLSKTDGNSDVCLLSLNSAGGLQMRNFVSWYGNKIGFSESANRTTVAMSCQKTWDATTFTFVPMTGSVYSNGEKKTNISEQFYYTSAVNYIGVSLNTSSVSRFKMAGYWYSIRVYDRVLSEEEISHNATIDKVRFGL